ncbi:hypothetical protein [Sphingomonas sp. M1A8_2b]
MVGTRPDEEGPEEDHVEGERRLLKDLLTRSQAGIEKHTDLLSGVNIDPEDE